MSPSPFVAEWIRRLAPRGRTLPAGPPMPVPRGPQHASSSVAGWESRGPRALDLAMGTGRHALLLAQAGFRTYGVDVKCEAVADAVRAAAREHLLVRGWCADLTMFPLPRAAWELVVVARYLQRDLFASIREALQPGGYVIYETFTVHQRALGTGPTSPQHLLEPGELRMFFDGWNVLFNEETLTPEAVARLVAERPASG